MEHASARTLLTGVVDYAGLFPPAALSMSQAVAEYHAAQTGPDAWMLGRFVLPAARLDEFARARAGSPAQRDLSKLSAIVRDGSKEDCSAIDAFNAASASHSARVDALECKPQTMDGIDWLADACGGGFDVYVEVAPAADAPLWLEHIARRGLRGKVRTGGVTPDAFPTPEALATFIEAAVRLGVTFKATAGLHHAVRGAYPLTYEPQAARSTMHGYLNVLLATAAVQNGASVAAATTLLRCSDPASLVVTSEFIRWAGIEVSTASLRRTREQHLVSFGSCSFREPAGEYHELERSSLTRA
jgi:hypothetical protein